MNQEDEKAIRAGVRHMLERRQQAFDRFASQIANKAQIPLEDGAKVAALYIGKAKAAKYNGLDYVVKHGAFFDYDVIMRALAMVKKV